MGSGIYGSPAPRGKKEHTCGHRSNIISVMPPVKTERFDDPTFRQARARAARSLKNRQTSSVNNRKTKVTLATVDWAERS